MTYLFFIASFNAFFFLVLLLQKRPRQLHDRILICWLFYLGMATAAYALTIEFSVDSPLLSSGIIASFLLHGPFLYLYVSSLTSTQKHFRSKDLLHFIPFIAFILYLTIASRFPAYAEGIRVDHISHDAEPSLLFHILLMITALSGPIYFYVSYKRFLQSKKSSHDFYSKEPSLNWLGKLIPIFGAVWTILIIIAVIHHIFHLFSMDFCTNGLFISLSVFIILLSYYGLKQNEVLITYPLESKIESDTEPEKYAASKLEDEELQKCCDKVGRYMITEKPYLDSDLTLPKLASDLDVSTHHLSQIINEVHGKNFFNFINQYRVEEVKRKIQDEKFQNYSLLGIALESGFNSKSAFNRVFKDVTGTTPSSFRDSLPSS